jgi:hypothetical protein
MRVAIDTNIFHNDRSLSGGSFEVLARLAEAGYVEILIPEVVAKEFASLSSEQIEGAAKVQEAIKGIRSVFPKKFTSRIDALKKDFKELSKSLEFEARSTFDQWMQRVNGRVINPGGDHAQRILTKYFDGSLPFGSRKARTDFPDAFIAEIILDLAVNQELFFVTFDKRMQTAFADVSNITVFDSLENLLRSKEFVALQDKFNLAPHLPRIVQIINENKDSFSDALLEEISNLAREADYKGREEEESLYIDILEDLTEWTLDTNDAENIGEGVISFSFEATVEASVDQPTDYGMDWFPYYDRPVIDATLYVGGVCSFIIDPNDLANPATCLEVEGWVKRTRLEVDELHYVNVFSINPENVEEE